MKIYCLGIDEAGRGPLIGNLYIVGVLIEKSKLNNLDEDIKDSKELDQKKREEIFEKYSNLIYFVKEIKPREIDSKNLNQIEADYFREIITESFKLLEKKEENFELEVYIDLPEKKERFLRRINLNKRNVKLILEHKADKKYKIVSLASIFAKVLRERHIQTIKEKLNLDFGSGYPSDPETRRFIEILKRNEELLRRIRPFIRKKWDTARFLFNKNIIDFINKK
ncbi:MAG TPA: ribonuclease HII [Nautiliaceae bacterium]|nr:ribonuclease HII [Nautiliaceae bacterium]